MNKIIVSLVLMLAVATSAFAGSTTLAWDASTTPGVEYYTVYQMHGSGEYGILFDGITDLVITWDTTSYDGSYEYYVTANKWGEESIPSNIVAAGYGKPNPPRNAKAQKHK